MTRPITIAFFLAILLTACAVPAEGCAAYAIFNPRIMKSDKTVSKISPACLTANCASDRLASCQLPG